MKISIIISTRNRDDSVCQTIESILANSVSEFEIIIVDQSTNDNTEKAIKKYSLDPRLKYIRTSTTGLSISRNIGFNNSSNDIIAFTDDDCTVQPDWLNNILQYFKDNQEIGALFGTVKAAEKFNLSEGFLPAFEPEKLTKIIKHKSFPLTSPMGANMAFRRLALEEIRAFDTLLGPGAPLKSADDIDAVYRVFAKGYPIHIVPEIIVIHFGFRAYNTGAGSKILFDSMFANGAYYSKHVRCGDVTAFKKFIIEIFNLLKATGYKVMRNVRPFGLRLPIMMLWGFLYPFRFKVDKKRRMYYKT